MPVHLFGQCADMPALNQIAQEAGNIPVIEDAAQAIGAQLGGQRAGSLSELGCFSFYPTKNLGGFGDGGMITTNDDALAAKIRILRDHGQQPRYTHALVGVNSRLDTLQAAVLKVKLPHLDSWAAGRQQNAERYAAEFARLGLAERIGVPPVAKDCVSVWNQYTIRVPDGLRDALQQYLSDRKIGSAIYYPIPLHLQTCFAELGYREGSLPVTEQAAHQVLSLPVFAELVPDEQDRVIDALAEFFGMAHSTADLRRAA
jgi:dTDP-4-amino-4,6-dideoxygalactose transaminase